MFSDNDWDEIYVQMSAQEVGRRIIQRRTDIGMSLENLAAHLKKSISTISRIERGVQELTLDQLYHVADVLDVSHFELLAD